jgi:hypothetical protein
MRRWAAQDGGVSLRRNFNPPNILAVFFDATALDAGIDRGVAIMSMVNICRLRRLRLSRLS